MRLTHRRRGTIVEKEKEGVIATGKRRRQRIRPEAGLDAAAAGIEATKEVAVTAGTAVTEAVSSLATKARKAIRGRPARKTKPKPPAKKPTVRKASATARKTAPKKAGAKKPATRSTRKTAKGRQIRAGKAAGGEAQTQNCCATSIQTDEALERSLTRSLARTWFLSCLLTRTDPTAGM